jgi:adenosine deaminase
MVLTPVLDEFIRRMPKVELHLHLEGAVTPQTLLDLSQRNGVVLPAQTARGVAELFNYEDFGAFLNVFMDLTRAFVHGEDFARLAYELGYELAGQHVRYAEVMISPMQHLRRGLDLQEVIEGSRAGFDQVERETGLIVNLALDHGRQYGPEPAWQILEVAQITRRQGVVGWSIGGNEIDYPPEPFAEVFAAAHAAGLGLMAHAGEVVGPKSVWGAIDHLGVSRLGHGIRSISDPALIDALRTRNIVLDICPSSNIYTGAVASWADHPLRQLYDAGVPLTLNSDDPTFFHTTLTDEYRLAAIHYNFGVEELCTSVRTATNAAFLPASERIALQERLDAELAVLRAELGV